MQFKKKIILDTDIGSDIDDAVCLAYLLSHPDCELVGITTVSGQPERRAMLASALCVAANKDVPIYPGVETPLLSSQRQPLVQQADALGNSQYRKSFPQGEAIEFMRKTIRNNPGKITLLCIGPMTNAALLFSVDPEIPKLLKQLVLMCGVFTNRLAGVGPFEWNAVCDPAATAIVYKAPVKIHHSIGLDVTCQLYLPKDEIKKKFKADIFKPVLDFAGVWFEHADGITFHDPLAAVTIFEPKLCGFERGNVEVELCGGRCDGMTHWNADPNGRHEAALSVDKELFFNSFFSVFDK